MLQELSQFRLQAPQVQKLLKSTLLWSAWHSHSVSVLQTMISREDKEEREFTVKTILKLQGRKKEGDLIPRA